MRIWWSVENWDRHKRVISISMRFHVPLNISRSSARVNWCQGTVFFWSISKRHQQRNCLAVSIFPSLCFPRQEKKKYRLEARSLPLLNCCRCPGEKKLLQRSKFVRHLGRCFNEACACSSIGFPELNLKFSHHFSWWAQGQHKQQRF